MESRSSTTRRQVRMSEILIPKYLAVFNDRKHKHIILTSGRAGTKSSYAAIRTDYLIVSDKGAAAVVLRKHHNKLRKTVYKEMLRGLNRLGLNKKKFEITKSPMEIRYKKHGTTIYFTGSDSIDDTKGIIDEDKKIKLVVLDELTEFFEDGEGEDEISNIEATFIRGNSGGEFQMIYLYNPPKNPNAAINEWCRKMEQRDDCIHIHTDYRDVPPEWLGSDLIESAEMMKANDEKQYRWVWLGQSVGVDELIYYMFSGKNVKRPEDESFFRLVYIGGDYGQQNATTFQAFGLDEYNFKFTGLEEYFHSGRDTGKQRSPSEYAQDFCDFCDMIMEKYSTKQLFLFLDPSAKGLQEEIKRTARERNIPVIVRDADNDVKLGISRVQKALKHEIMTVSPLQKNAVREFGIYEYDKKLLERGKEEPVKIDDHAMDAIRYGTMGAWKYLKQWLPKWDEEDYETEKAPLPNIGEYTDEHL